MTAASYSMSAWTSTIPALTAASLVPSTVTSVQASLLPTSTIASGPNGKVRLILHTTAGSIKAQVASQGCEIVHELINSTAVACPPDIKVPNSEPDAILHISDLQADRQIRADQVWALGYTGSGVTVAVLDTGVDLTHPELTSSIVGGESFVGYTTSYADDNGHGTHVSGIITSDGIADASSKGAAYNAPIWMAKVCDASGNCYTSDMEAAIQYIVTNHIAKIMSISIAGHGTSSSNCDGDGLASYVNWAYDNAVVSAIAAGNYPDLTGDPQNFVSSPACASKAIAVAAVNPSDNWASFSRYGTAVLDHGVAAPGVSIYSTLPGGAYGYKSGTSMATPHVSAAIALILQKNPNLSQAVIRSMILNSANCLGGKYGSCPNTYIGYGRVDAFNALSLNVGLVAPVNGATLTGSPVTFQARVTDFAGAPVQGAGVVVYVIHPYLSITYFCASSSDSNGYFSCDITLTDSGTGYRWYATASKSSYGSATSQTWTFAFYALVTTTNTSTETSTLYSYGTTTKTFTSYTSTTTSTSTIPAVTTVVLVPLSMTSTVQSTQFLTSFVTTTVTSYASTTTSTSTTVVYTTVTLLGAAAASSSPLAYVGLISLLAAMVGHRVTASKGRRIPRVESRLGRRCSKS